MPYCPTTKSSIPYSLLSIQLRRLFLCKNQLPEALKKRNYYYYTFQKNGKRYLDVSLKEGEYRNAIKKANALYIDTADEEELTPNSFALLLYAYLDREKVRVEKRQLSISTYKEKRRILTTHVLGHFAQNKDITTVTVLDIEDYCDLRLETLNAILW